MFEFQNVQTSGTPFIGTAHLDSVEISTETIKNLDADFNLDKTKSEAIAINDIDIPMGEAFREHGSKSELVISNESNVEKNQVSPRIKLIALIFIFPRCFFNSESIGG